MTEIKREQPVDAVVIGAGFAGIFMLHKLRNELGLTVRAFDKAGGIGGTWYWNRYPGALSDSLSHLYCFSFDDDLLKEWDWPNRYSTRPQILAYLEHVVDRFDLRGSITLNTGVRSATFDESDNHWHVVTDTGDRLVARYLVPAVGQLHAAIRPDIPGLESFRGVTCHTAEWPEDLELAGKRIGVIGTGSTGTQLVTAIAPTVEHLTVFMRRAQYSVPIGNRPLTDTERNDLKANARQIWYSAYSSFTAFGIDPEPPERGALEVSEAQRQSAYQKAWDNGGPFHFFTGTFNDVIMDMDANETAAAFIREKIKETVHDPDTARKLTPNEPWARRPVADSGYLNTFNRDNVSLVALAEQPIERITPDGIRTADGTEIPLDVIVFATGFDGMSGSYKRVPLRGRGGVDLSEHWRDGMTAMHGFGVAGYPNMFLVLGPYVAFSNNPPCISTVGDAVGQLIKHTDALGAATVEPRVEAEAAYVAECDAISQQTVMLSIDHWFNGGNIPGKPKQLALNFKGIGVFRDTLLAEERDGYPSFEFGSSRAAAVPNESKERRHDLSSQS